MGVKGLWGVLSPVKQHTPLTELRGLTLAVDLSIWIVEAQEIKQSYGINTKVYLRNLFFRVNHLVQLGVRLVFVTEGEPPELKWQTMAHRQAGRGRGKRFNNRGKHVASAPMKKPKRTRFNFIIKECCQMLEYLGIPWVQSSGEAEAMCALLNNAGVVDGVLSQDGDCFLYGARTVYRNFTMSSKDRHVECYEMKTVEQRLSLNREKLVVFALFLGCDYCEKITGINRGLAMRFLTNTGDPIKRIQHWNTRTGQGELQQMSVKKGSHCTSCRHQGSCKEHKTRGCVSCGLKIGCQPLSPRSCACDWCHVQKWAEPMKHELPVWKKTSAVKSFPDNRVIDEFLNNNNEVPSTAFQWKQPRLYQMERYMYEKLEWPESYSIDKVLPLVTMYDMRNILYPECEPHKNDFKITPLCIVKSRVRQFVSCYEVHWNIPDCYKVNDVDTYVTVEEQEIFNSCYPDIVEQYQLKLEDKIYRKPSKKKRVKPTASTTDVDLLQNKMSHVQITSYSNMVERVRSERVHNDSYLTEMGLESVDGNNTLDQENEIAENAAKDLHSICNMPGQINVRTSDSESSVDGVSIPDVPSSEDGDITSDIESSEDGASTSDVESSEYDVSSSDDDVSSSDAESVGDDFDVLGQECCSDADSTCSDDESLEAIVISDSDDACQYDQHHSHLESPSPGRSAITVPDIEHSLTEQLNRLDLYSADDGDEERDVIGDAKADGGDGDASDAVKLWNSSQVGHFNINCSLFSECEYNKVSATPESKISTCDNEIHPEKPDVENDLNVVKHQCNGSTSLPTYDVRNKPFGKRKKLSRKQIMAAMSVFNDSSDDSMFSPNPVKAKQKKPMRPTTDDMFESILNSPDVDGNWQKENCYKHNIHCDKKFTALCHKTEDTSRRSLHMGDKSLDGITQPSLDQTMNNENITLLNDESINDNDNDNVFCDISNRNVSATVSSPLSLTERLKLRLPKAMHDGALRTLSQTSNVSSGT